MDYFNYIYKEMPNNKEYLREDGTEQFASIYKAIGWFRNIVEDESLISVIFGNKKFARL